MQRTYRENGKVKTECFYVSALNDDNGKGGTWARFSRRKALISPPRKRCTLGRPFLRRGAGSAFVFMSLGYHRLRETASSRPNHDTVRQEGLGKAHPTSARWVFSCRGHRS